MSALERSSQIREQFEHLHRVIGSDRFLKMEGLNNDLPFFICAYKPEAAVEYEALWKQLVNQLGNDGVAVLEINLYDLTIELLKSEGDWEATLEVEPETPKDAFLEHMQSLLDPESNLIPAIGKKLRATDYQVLFITGVGEVYPYLRLHNVLNNLQKVVKDRPAVMFFPGQYKQSVHTGAALSLFDRLRDDRYYRAFNIFHQDAQS